MLTCLRVRQPWCVCGGGGVSAKSGPEASQSGAWLDACRLKVPTCVVYVVGGALAQDSPTTSTPGLLTLWTAAPPLRSLHHQPQRSHRRSGRGRAGAPGGTAAHGPRSHCVKQARECAQWEDMGKERG